MAKNGTPSSPPPFNPFGGFGGLGQPGVRETKVVGETSEIKIPRKQFLETWIFSFLLMILGYGCLKLLIVDRGDWSLLIGILTIPMIFIIYLFFERKIAYKFFPNIYAEFIAMLQRMAGTDDAGRFILFAFVLAVVGLTSVGFYISVIVPQITLILDQQAQFVFVFAAFISLLFAFIPYYKFNRRQLVDSLRDSDSAYAREALKLEFEERQRREEARQMIAAPIEDGRPKSTFFEALPVIRAATKPTAQLSSAQERFKTAILDFLDGIDAGDWSTNERSWRNDMNGRKVLPNSQMYLVQSSGGTTVGGMIRDWLIRSGWAAWNNADEPQRGWKLLYSTQEIRDGIFRYGTQASPEDGAGGVGDAGSETFSFSGEDDLS